MFENETPPIAVLDARHEEIVDIGETARRLTMAISEGLMRRFQSADPDYGDRHDLVFLLRSVSGRNNAKALQAWVQDLVVELLASGVENSEIFAFVDRSLQRAMYDAGWR